MMPRGYRCKETDMLKIADRRLVLYKLNVNVER